MSGRYKNMVTVEETEVTICTRCRCYKADSDAQTVCHQCTHFADDEIPKFLQTQSVVIDINKKNHKYSKGVILYLMVDAASSPSSSSSSSSSSSYETEIIYEQSPLFSHIITLEKGDKIDIEGWIDDKIIDLASVKTSD